MKTQQTFLTRYSELEYSVSTLMSQLFSGICGSCTACCCRADICEEATESAFLSLLLEKQGLGREQMDDRYGWLDLHGCTLEYGRPPVCYAYYCDQLLARLPDEEAQFSAKVLGKLIQHIGENALGGWHLVEIMDRSDLAKLNYPELFQRLEEAQAAYSVIEHFMQAGRLTKADYNVLNVITDEEL
ncbi:hypothetical protein P4E94_15970 [Pontiellaceae bacterium B12219]|nr:hypothetical protein [Pontiellaceae bacterium B12219]